jgi:ankyrin repeat protein
MTKRDQVIVSLLDSLQQWIAEDTVNPREEEIKQDWLQFLSFTPPKSFLSLLSKLSPDYGLSIGYELQYIDSKDAMRRSFCYNQCFQEFYRLTELIPILDHGSGRNFDLYDCQTGAIIQFSIIDSPLEWIVLAKSFDEVTKHFYQILQRAQQQNMPLPNSIYSSNNGNDQNSFKSLLETFPGRAHELNEILPRPLVLRTHQPGTWQIDKPCRVHEIIQNSITDDITDLQTHLEAHPNDIRQKTSKKSEPIHEACRLGRINCLKFLMQRIQETSGLEGVKAALAARDASKSTPLLTACQESFRTNPNLAQCIDFVLSYGPEVIDVNCCQDEGQAALHFMASQSYPYFVRKLIQLGANVHQRDKDEYAGNTPLHSLCRSRGGARYDARSPSDRVFTLDRSFDLTERSSILTLLLLIEAGADVNALTIGGNSSPLHLLMWGSGMEDNSQMVEILCKNGANVNAVTSTGATVLGSGFAREKYFDILSRYGVLEEREPKRRIVTKTFTGFISSDSSSAPVLKTANAVMGMTANEAIRKLK